MPASARRTRAIRRTVLGWYASERRDFPWRRTTDPYAVLVSEVMLQQTQASRVVDRYESFLRSFGSARALADADPAAVLAAWNGLGYNRRALALQRAAAEILRDGWPRDVAGLERLPGVGPYTARAIASLAFGVPVGVVDTNVRRWLLRRFDVADSPRSLQALADSLAAGAASGGEAAAWTHATMELGARVCRARTPRCDSCPVASGCPSRGRARRVPVVAQAPFPGSTRADRGELVRALAAAPGYTLSLRGARRAVGRPLDRIGLERLIAALERDGLVHRTGGRLHLGADRSTAGRG
jgi:A/G-specific adenine glycosylase